MANLADADVSEEDKIKVMLNQSTYDSMKWVTSVMLSNLLLHTYFCLLGTSIHLFSLFLNSVSPCSDVSLSLSWISLLCSIFMPRSICFPYFFFHMLQSPCSSVIFFLNLSTSHSLSLSHSSYNKKFGTVLPTNYTCYRCGNTGHHIRNCPTSGVTEAASVTACHKSCSARKLVWLVCFYITVIQY